MSKLKEKIKAEKDEDKKKQYLEVLSVLITKLSEARELDKIEASKIKQEEPKQEEPKQEEPPPTKVSVTRIQIDGKLYLISKDNILYDPDTKEEVGLWNPKTKNIEELPDEEEEEEEEEEPPTKISVGRIQISGKKYLISKDNILYDPDTKEEVGIWNLETKTIEELPDEEDEEEEEEEPPPTKVSVTRLQIDGKLYLKSKDNILYDPDTKEEVGLWNPKTKTIEEIPDEDDDEDEEEDDEEEEVSKDDLFAFLYEPREDKRKDNLTKEQIISRIDELEEEQDKLYIKKEKKQDEYLIKNPNLKKKINKNDFFWRKIFDRNLKISVEEDKRLDEIEDELKDLRFNQKNYDFIKDSRQQISTIRRGKGLGINNYSNPKVVQSKAKKYLGKDTLIQFSNKKDKKYMVYDPNTEKMIHFGQMGYEDFTKHKDENRRQRYLNRATKIKGNWKDNKYSPNNLSIHLLW